MTVIGRFDRPDGRWYIDPLDPDARYESVTSILAAATGKPWLAPWAAKTAARFAVRHLDLVRQTLTDVDETAAIEMVTRASARDRDLKADVGSFVHNVVEALILDMPYPSIPDDLAGKTVDYDGEDVTICSEWLDSIADGFLAFVEDFDPIFEMAEATVVNPADGVAGTLDMIAVLPKLGVGTRVMIDTKTGAQLDPGMNAQLAAYRRCTEVWLDNLGNRAPLPRVDRAAVLHLRTSYDRGYKLLQVPADDDAYAWFLHHLAVLRGQAAQPKIKGSPLYPARPDGTQPAPLIEDVEWAGFNPCRKKLIAAGIRSLTDLAALTEAEALTVRGVGASALRHARDVLTHHGLAFAAPLTVKAVA